MLTLSKANRSDIVPLRDLAVNAFDEDKIYRPNNIEDGEPPGIGSVEKHEQWLNSKIYLKCTQNDMLVGSCILDIIEDRGVIGGLHVAPDVMNSGIGSWIINKILGMYPNVSTWTLETPDYAIRNHHFYEKNQFVLKEITPLEPSLGFGFYKYERTVPQSIKSVTLPGGLV
jgi:GNAT superfamily N-acetyltransferase